MQLPDSNIVQVGILNIKIKENNVFISVFSVFYTYFSGADQFLFCSKNIENRIFRGNNAVYLYYIAPVEHLRRKNVYRHFLCIIRG